MAVILNLSILETTALSRKQHKLHHFTSILNNSNQQSQNRLHEAIRNVSTILATQVVQNTFPYTTAR
jgi:hypothetical protein